jgi:5-methylcytosine-specific restriction endonuclease McrA
MATDKEERKKERGRINARKHYPKNKERQRQYRIARGLDYYREYMKEYRSQRQKAGAGTHHSAIARAKELNVLPAHYEEEKDKIQKVYEKRAELQKLWGIDLTVDHIVSLEVGGLHEHSNLQILHRSLNNRKQHKMGHFEKIKEGKYRFIITQ